MPWYRTGTVAITAGQTTVTGTGTNFSANGRVGDALLGPDGRWYEVTNIASGTVLSILPAYQGATVSSGAYAITPVQGYTKALADKFNDIANTWGSTLAGLGTVSTENVVPIAKGGTGKTTAAEAKAALGIGDIGVGQTWKNMTGSRALGTTYTNTTGKPIQISVFGGAASAAGVGYEVASGASMIGQYSTAAGQFLSSPTVIIPAGATYTVNVVNGTAPVLYWRELS
ncbi:hypothetical protein [Pseudomonas sp.]|uniref:hypothetical protein n=1 Tax=Pseudomonas sp. TaxID=306 RepID=UPI0028AFE573|nr:hypothetical protein [Pseudomonas sp.]